MSMRNYQKQVTTVHDLFRDRTLVIASMHGKELVMRPLIHQYLPVSSITVPQLDTDVFGTFTGEVARVDDPVTTLRNKINAALDLSGETLGIGNEGSFGPHPRLPFVYSDQELVMLIDRVNGIEVTASALSTRTNFAQQRIDTHQDLVDFASRIEFPSHGMILKQLTNGKVTAMRKGILHWEALQAACVMLKKNGTELLAESDMRALYNPTRMTVIEQATKNLMKKITTLCPDCRWPGFSCVEVQPGLPCSQCGEPTELPLQRIYQCEHCGYQDERIDMNKRFADPQFCNHCNP